jgi:ElaB/YqjD/DUF883 family membrane-anchored ribosome-binding protein
MTEYQLQELEALKLDMAKLGSDLIALTEKLTDIGKDGVGAAKEELEKQAKNLKKTSRKIFKETRKMGKKTAETVEEQIEDRPLLNLVVATGVGFLLGVLITWKLKGGDSD